MRHHVVRLFALAFVSMPILSAYPARSTDNITIYVTDFGIRHWKTDLKMFDDFAEAEAQSVVPGLDRRAQILVPMSVDKDLPKRQLDRQQAVRQIANGIIKRIDQGGSDTYEVRIVQNINALGYVAPWRQAAVKDFGRVVYQALAIVKQRIANRGTDVQMPAIVGSNGAFLLTETLPELESCPIDRAILVDGRAHIEKVWSTYVALGGEVSIINTAGDAPSFGYMIANHETAKFLKRLLPGIKVYWVDVKGLDIIITRHLASMNPEAILLVKEFTGWHYSPSTKLTAWKLMTKALGKSQITLASVSIGDDVKRAILEENWEEVIKLLSRDGSLAYSPVARMLMAHACLATNRNNESFRLIFSTKASSEVEQWRSWATRLASENSNNAVAHYLLADSEARVGNLSEAITLLNQAIAKKEGREFSLAYNARGVALFSQHETDAALIDFFRAIQANPKLADAYVNLSTHFLLRSESSEYVLKTLDTALKLNPESALAHNARGCAYFGLGRYQEAKEAFDVVKQLCPEISISQVNKGVNLDYASREVLLGLIQDPNLHTRWQASGFGTTAPIQREIEERSTKLQSILDARERVLFAMTAKEWATLSDGEFTALVDEFGRGLIQIVGAFKLEELKRARRVAESQLESAVKRQMSATSLSSKILTAEIICSLGTAAYGTTKNVGKGWKEWIKKPGEEIETVGVAVTKSMILRDKDNLQAAVDLTPILARLLMGIKLDPVSLSGTALEYCMKPFRYLSDDTVEAARAESCQHASTADTLSMLIASLDDKLDGLRPLIVESELRVATQSTVGEKPMDRRIKVLSMTGDRSFEELGLLALVVDRSVEKSTTSSRRILLVCQDRRQSRFLQDLFHRYGLLVKVIQSQTRMLPEAVAFNADVILDIKDKPPHRLPGYTGAMEPLYVLSKFAYNNTDPNYVVSIDPNRGADLPLRWDYDRNDPNDGPEDPNGGGSGATILVADSLPSDYFYDPNDRDGGGTADIPVYYASIDKPLSELGGLVSKVDKNVAPKAKSPRRVLVVSQDPFRANLLQSQLSLHGFETIIVPDINSAQRLGQTLNADVILGVTRTKEQAFMGGSNVKQPRQSISGPTIKMPSSATPPNWQDSNWGKPYVPPSRSEVPPGGVRTEDIANAKVDRGNWPVLSLFSLGYGMAPEPIMERGQNDTLEN